jgi:class 3 adenylate cyclase
MAPRRRLLRRPSGRPCARANEDLAKQQASPLPKGLTLHSLRRTYASILFAIGRTAPEVMEQLGHSDARLTLRVYARAMSSDIHEKARLNALVDGDSLGTIGHCASNSPVRCSDRPLPRGSNSPPLQAIRQVEPTGIEPVTSCLQSRRSPS